jgi:hypothetical protein
MVESLVNDEVSEVKKEAGMIFISSINSSSAGRTEEDGGKPRKTVGVMSEI